jgi:hypothetical protein
MEQRLRSGEPCRAETFISSNPTLASDPDLALDLILREFAVRRELGEAVDPEEWLRRFPQWEEPLRRLLSLQIQFSGSVRESRSTVIEVEGRRCGPAEGIEDPPPELGRLELVEEIGKGGMGTVYRARDTVLNREVALKRIRADGPVPPQLIQRFYREARVIAQLHHPNIVPIYGMGLHEGQHCFIMPLIKGGSLATHKERYYADPRAAAALVEKIARAVAAAHARGIVHRDLKPGNVLLDENGEPLVADFGLAKFTDSNVELTAYGMLGTPAYMSPEQATGQGWKVTLASDVWALGVILYELLTGQRPFPGNSAEAVAKHIVNQPPTSLTQLRPEVDADLETIVLRCLEKNSDRRYPSALALAEDLHHWLAGERIRSRRATRKKPMAIGAGFGLLALVLVLFFAFPRPGHHDLPSEMDENQRMEEALREMRDDLAAGKPVVLLGNTGNPRWYRWRLDDRKPALPNPEDGPLALESFRFGFLDLLPEVPCPQYRLSAEILHNQSNGGYVGLFFAATKQPTEEGIVHRFGTMTFADQGEQAGNILAENYFGYLEKAAGGVERSSLVLASTRFAPTPRNQFPQFHYLAVEIRTERIDFFWDDPNRPLRTWKRSDLENAARIKWREKHGKDSPLPYPVLPSTGALGVATVSSTALIRNVVLTPLSD